MSYGVDIFHRAVRHQQSIFMIKVIAVDGRMLEGLLHCGAIFRMGALDNKLQGRFRRPVTLKDPENFV